ncbi:PhzF family phenazine biosynthesis protein [Paenibacillus sp. FSL R7-0345]|uniref:PhzF family phenazine biosynthesis protein n=1 Tax=Paenibacillus sp. FSL R7-0345 TaxID=2954535 RepID=UPI003159DA1E
MNTIPYYIVDVFGEKRYAGNQLAVFRHASNLPQELLQTIAKEINFAETTFIGSDEQVDGGYNVRIFTPDTEVPFAGHPTLGTAYIIRQEIEQKRKQGLGLAADSGGTITLNLGVGQIPVTVADQQELWMKQKPPQFGRTVDPAVIAGILGINAAELDPDFPVQEVSTGLASIIVPLRSLEAVNACRLNHAAFEAFLATAFRANILVFCKETVQADNNLHVRVFCEDSGFPEDAATGSANGNLAGYLLKYDYLGASELRYRVEQGYKIGRPSLIHVKASLKDSSYDINVGGQVHPVARGEWIID